jgi:hypothetical protein
MAKLSYRASGALAPIVVMATSIVWAAAQPDAPPSVCVNGKCVPTPVAPATGAGIKWHPGQYMLSSVYTQAGNGNLSTKQTEQAIVRAGPSVVLGWEGVYFWPVFENATAGAYDFSVLDADYTAITGYTSGSGASAVYSSPRRMSIELWHDYYFSGTGTVVTPTYMLNNSTYGASPTSGSYGFWTANGYSGAGTGQVTAIWRPAVMNRFIALVQALAAHRLPDGYTVDTSPYIESVQFPSETADLPSYGINDSTYSDSTYITELQALATAAAAAYPHTNVVMRNNYLENATPTYSLELSLPSARNASGGPDIFGYSSGQNVTSTGCGLGGVTWGQAAYIGLKPGSGSGNWVSGGTNLIGTVPYIGTIQNTEMVAEYGCYYTPADLFRQANTTLHATHLAWQYDAGFPQSGQNAEDVTANWFGNAGNQSAWNSGKDTAGGVLTTIYNNTLTNTSCPSSYNNSCNVQ